MAWQAAIENKTLSTVRQLVLGASKGPAELRYHCETRELELLFELELENPSKLPTNGMDLLGAQLHLELVSNLGEVLPTLDLLTLQVADWTYGIHGLRSRAGAREGYWYKFPRTVKEFWQASRSGKTST